MWSINPVYTLEKVLELMGQLGQQVQQPLEQKV
jgi:hypothetical protein